MTDMMMQALEDTHLLELTRDSSESKGSDKVAT